MTSISILGIIIAVNMTPSTINTIIVMMSIKIRSSRLTLTFATIIIVITSIIIITIGAIIDCCC